MRRKLHRGGYAMLLVVGFLILFLALLGVACSQMGAALRIQTARALQIQRDEGSIQALAQGLALLETGLPPTNPYSCGVTINTSTGPGSFTVTFASTGTNSWSVNAAPSASSQSPPAMPSTFSP